MRTLSDCSNGSIHNLAASSDRSECGAEMVPRSGTAPKGVGFSQEFAPATEDVKGIKNSGALCKFNS